MSNAWSLYWHTLRYLRPVQLYGRVAFRLFRPAPDLRPAPPARVVAAGWQQPAPRTQCLHDDGRFEFLGMSHRLDEVGWDDPAIGKLWRYNLHYFDDLVSTTAGTRVDVHRALIERWIRENPAGQGSGWEPYPTSLRIVNWAKWLLAGNAPVPGMLQSLAVQARWVAKRIEWHLQGNHLWVNGKALVFAGCLFSGNEAVRWREDGLKIIRAELREQVLADGAHFERTPMYHALFLEDLLDLINLARAFPACVDDDVAGWRGLAPRLIAWLQGVSHGDVLAHFNDVAQGIAPAVSALRDYAMRLDLVDSVQPSPEQFLAGAGLVRLEEGSAVVIADVAPVGPDYIPGHAHADTLSFEMSLRGARLFVNEGTSTYETSPERLRQRGTAAHNTVVVDGQDSSEVWASFRVARRARIVHSGFHRDGAISILEAEHDGYRRLGGGVGHRRRWELGPSQLKVIDELAGRYGSAEARLLLAPGWRAREAGPGISIEGPGGTVTLSVEGGATTLQDAVYCAGFGQSCATQRICIRFTGQRLTTTLTW